MTVREIMCAIGELSNEERRELFFLLAEAEKRAASVKYIERDEAVRIAEKIFVEHEELFRKLAAYESANPGS